MLKKKSTAATPTPRRLQARHPAPEDIQTAFREALEANPRTRSLEVRDMTLARVPLGNQHELVAELWTFEDGGIALGREYGWKNGAVLLFDGHALESRKVSLRPSDHYLVASVPREADPRRPYFIRMHVAMALAFHGVPKQPGMLVRHRLDRRHRNGAADLSWGCRHENREDYDRNRKRARARDRVVLVKAKTARAAKAKLGIKGERLNRLVDGLLKKHLAAA